MKDRDRQREDARLQIKPAGKLEQVLDRATLGVGLLAIPLLLLAPVFGAVAVAGYAAVNAVDVDVHAKRIESNQAAKDAIKKD